MIKVILISTFCANSEDSELIDSLTRKMSSCSAGTQEVVATNINKIEK